MVRKILSVLGGVIVGMIAMAIGVTISSAIYGPQNPESLQTPEAFEEFVRGLPPAAFAIVLGAHIGGTFIGGATCGLIAARRWTAGTIIVGVVFLIGGIINLMTLPHPVWFAIVDLLCYLPAALLGNLVAGRRAGNDQAGNR